MRDIWEDHGKSGVTEETDDSREDQKWGRRRGLLSFLALLTALGAAVNPSHAARQCPETAPWRAPIGAQHVAMREGVLVGIVEGRRAGGMAAMKQIMAPLFRRVFKSYDDIVNLSCEAWNKLIDQPWKIMSIGRREWAHGF